MKKESVLKINSGHREILEWIKKKEKEKRNPSIQIQICAGHREAIQWCARFKMIHFVCTISKKQKKKELIHVVMSMHTGLRFKWYYCMWFQCCMKLSNRLYSIDSLKLVEWINLMRIFVCVHFQWMWHSFYLREWWIGVYSSFKTDIFLIGLHGLLFIFAFTQRICKNIVSILQFHLAALRNKRL